MELQGSQLKQWILVPPTNLHHELHHKASCALASEWLRLPKHNSALDTRSHQDWGAGQEQLRQRSSEKTAAAGHWGSNEWPMHKDDQHGNLVPKLTSSKINISSHHFSTPGKFSMLLPSTALIPQPHKIKSEWFCKKLGKHILNNWGFLETIYPSSPGTKMKI